MDKDIKEWGFYMPDGWEDFFEENKQLVDRCLEILRKRRQHLAERNIEIFPKKESELFESMKCIRPEAVKTMIIFPHPYSFDSGTGVPCMIKRNSTKVPISLINLQSAFPQISIDNFDKLWIRGIMLFNVALTEEQEHRYKIPHDIMWSLLFEKFLIYMSGNFKNINFIFTGLLHNKYMKNIDLLRGHKTIKAPYITDANFSEISNIV